MTRRFPVRTLTTTGLLLAVGLLLPMVFHSLFGAVGGRTFMPMHYAVLLGGLLLGPSIGLKAEPVAYVLAGIVTGLPGIAVQVVVIPLLLARGRLERSIADR
jgi:niacin transporter